MQLLFAYPLDDLRAAPSMECLDSRVNEFFFLAHARGHSGRVLLLFVVCQECRLALSTDATATSGANFPVRFAGCAGACFLHGAPVEGTPRTHLSKPRSSEFCDSTHCSPKNLYWGKTVVKVDRNRQPRERFSCVALRCS